VQSSGRQIRVVLADDVPEIMDAVAKRLSPDFTVVAKCCDGAALVECVIEFAPDLVVTDISMPKLTGIEALRLLRHRGVQTPTIILTVHQDEDLIKEALTLGVQGFVIKRRLITDLPLAIHAALNGGTFVSSESAAVEKTALGSSPAIVNEAATRAQVPTEILLNRNGLFIARSEGMNWRPIDAPGCQKKILFVDDREKSVTSIVRMQAGTHFPPHRHGGVEEVFILQGDLVVEGQPMKPGDYCRAERTTVHRESFTESGCVFLLKASQHDRILDDKSS
jgi:DNA-binding NarL/FixJ family response regulator/quercetin dioxygenase-like cupin family protein